MLRITERRELCILDGNRPHTIVRRTIIQEGEMMIPLSAVRLACWAFSHDIKSAMATSSDTVVLTSHATDVSGACVLVVDEVPASVDVVAAVLGY